MGSCKLVNHVESRRVFVGFEKLEINRYITCVHYNHTCSHNIARNDIYHTDCLPYRCDNIQGYIDVIINKVI